MANRRVVVTGIGIVSPLGLDCSSTWKSVLSADSGAGPISQFDASSWPTSFACEVKDFQLPDDALSPELQVHLNRPSSFGVTAALEAMKDSGLAGTVSGERLGICMGAGIGTISPQELSIMLHGHNYGNEVSPALTSIVEKSAGHEILRLNHPGTLAALLSARWGALGPVTTIHTACASSGQSLGQAYLQIARGEADAMLAGGADSLAGELLLAGFCLLGALSTRNDNPQEASRPFDRDRDGFVASEGAAVLILEERERALARGAEIYAEFGGFGETASAYRITDLPEDGRGIVQAMEGAVINAGLNFEDIGYINAHGTSTESNDRVEALGVRRVFGSRHLKPMVSSTKSETGHLISAAGAMEAAFAVMAVRDGLIPPTRNLHATNCGDDINFVAHKAREVPIKAAISNSVGFGGSNSAVLFKKVDG